MACAVLLLVHVPPDGVALNVVVPPIQTPGVPLIADGTGFIVSTLNAETPPHGVGIESMIVTVPADTPVTIPVVAPTVATAVLELYHVPVVVLESVVVAPTHTDELPVTVPGVPHNGLMSTIPPPAKAALKF